MAKNKSRQAGAATNPPQESKPATAGSDTRQDAITLLSSDHREVEKLFQKFEQASTAEDKEKTAKQICDALSIHTLLEEEIFYPACQAKGVEHDAMDEAQVEHDGAKILITELRQSTPSGEFYDAKMTVLSEYIKHHVGEEEKPEDGIFAQAKKVGVDLAELGQRIQMRRGELQLSDVSATLAKPAFKSLTTQANQSSQQESSMNRQFNGPHRDEQGRFESDDDYRSNRGRQGSRMNQDRDERRYSDDSRDRYGESDSYSRGGERDWQDERGYSGSNEEYESDRGRFEESGRYTSSGGRDRNDDLRDSDRYGGGGASRGYQSGGRDDNQDNDDRGYSIRSRGSQSRSSADYERGGNSGRDGYREQDYSQPGGGQRASSRGYDEEGDGGSDGRGRGWFGDSEGHSRASEEGWSHRGAGSREFSRGSNHERGRSSGGGSHSASSSGRGWHGDPQGHSQASEEGWSHRRGSRNGHSRNGGSGRSHNR